jgi:hypothetical protein
MKLRLNLANAVQNSQHPIIESRRQFGEEIIIHKECETEEVITFEDMNIFETRHMDSSTGFSGVN